MKKKINNSGAGHGPVQPTKGSAPEFSYIKNFENSVANILFAGMK
jgi:hypothetical protein